MIQRLFEIMNFVGSEWVLVVLLLLSVVTLAVILQRASTVWRLTQFSQKFWDDQGDVWLRNGDTDSWKVSLNQLEQQYPCPETEVLGLLSRSRAAGEKADRLVAAYLDQSRTKLERNVSVLGTIGANAPFVGLLGTVLGIIRAFHQIGAQGMSGGLDSVTGGIAEALVATAIGLFVAIPAVVAYNYLTRQIGLLVGRAQSLGSFLNPMGKG